MIDSFSRVGLSSFNRNRQILQITGFIKITFLEGAQKLIVEYKFDQFLLTRCQKKFYERSVRFFKNWFSGNSGLPSKIRLFQSYEAPWIQ